MAAMPRLWIGNFDFEHELATDRPAASADLLRIADELSFAWLGVAEPDDMVLTRHPPDESFLKSLANRLNWRPPNFISDISAASPEFVPTPWGWTRSVVNNLHRQGLRDFAHPDLDVVRRVNSREFSTLVEDQINEGRSVSCFVRTSEELHVALRGLAELHGGGTRWVLKANFSNSSRERLIGQGVELKSTQSGWAERRIARDGGIAVEPWLDIVEEASVQWEVSRDGGIELLGVVPQIVSSRGEYRGSWFACSGAQLFRWDDILGLSLRAAEKIAELGYFGPVGIDACRYRDHSGDVRLRAVQDINARWTMGRLSLGWQRLLRPFEIGCWRIQPARAGDEPTTAESMAAERGSDIPTTPDSLAGRPVSLLQWVEIVASGP
jgi:hypothetical protein